MKVCFIVGPQGREYQDTYYDKILASKNRVWLQNLPNNVYIDDDGNPYKSGKKYVRLDFAVGYYLKYYVKNHKIDLLSATKLSKQALKPYDLIINQFMDLLIVPFVKKYEKNNIPHEKLRELYDYYGHKIYPPVKYANMIYNKCAYYEFLNNINVTISPTYCISRKQFKENSNKYINALALMAYKNNWGKIFSKPVHGTDSVDISLLAKNYKISKESLPRLKKEIRETLTSLFKNPRYPQVVFQRYAKEFEKTKPQVRMYFVGNKHMYSILTFSNGDTFRPSSEVPTKYENENWVSKFNTKDLLENSKYILKKVQQKFFGRIPKLVTRIDYGCCAPGKKYFVNELEFNPGMYLHVDGERKFNMDKKIAKQLIKVIGVYNK